MAQQKSDLELSILRRVQAARAAGTEDSLARSAHESSVAVLVRARQFKFIQPRSYERGHVANNQFSAECNSPVPAWKAMFVWSGLHQNQGVTSETLGKYFLNRSRSRVAIFQPMISACAPMKKSGNGILGGALPPESRRAANEKASVPTICNFLFFPSLPRTTS